MDAHSCTQRGTCTWPIHATCTYGLLPHIYMHTNTRADMHVPQLTRRLRPFSVVYVMTFGPPSVRMGNGMYAVSITCPSAWPCAGEGKQ